MKFVSHILQLILFYNVLAIYNYFYVQFINVCVSMLTVMCCTIFFHCFSMLLSLFFSVALM